MTDIRRRMSRKSCCETGAELYGCRPQVSDYAPVRLTKLKFYPLFLHTQAFCSRAMFASQSNNAPLRNANIEKILEDLIEGVVRIAHDKNFLVC